jgi:hypothetical protein
VFVNEFIEQVTNPFRIRRAAEGHRAGHRRGRNRAARNHQVVVRDVGTVRRVDAMVVGINGGHCAQEEGGTRRLSQFGEVEMPDLA